MTCIVGFAYNGTVWLGADSSATSGDFLTVRADKKIFRNGDYLIGFSGSFRVGQLLRHAFSPPTCFGNDIEKFMVTDFVTKLIQLLENVEDKPQFLVGVKGRLFYILDDYQVAENISPYHAIGSGREPALGSLFTTCKDNMPVEDKLMIALQASQNFCSSVREPFYLEYI